MGKHKYGRDSKEVVAAKMETVDKLLIRTDLPFSVISTRSGLSTNYVLKRNKELMLGDPAERSRRYRQNSEV